MPATVWGLGITSLLTDISSEMIVSILPAYLVFTSGGVAPLLLGVATGLHEGGPLLVAWIGGWAADRSGRRRLTAGCGYALSALCRLGWLLLSGRTVTALAALVLGDRVGKAIRTAPRDALISLSVPPAQLATAFGVHRAMDAAGAAAGPVLAFVLLWQFPHRFDLIFFTSFIVSLLGLAALFLLVDERPTRAPTTATATATATAMAAPVMGTRRVWAQAVAAFADAAPRRVLMVAGAFGLVTIGDAFVYMLLVQRSQAHAFWIPLFYTGTACAFLLLAVLIGSVADRVGRRRVFVFGHAPLVLAYILALTGVPVWPWNAVICVGLLGAYYASTDGVLASVAGGLLPEPIRAMGLAWVDTAVSIARLCSALLFGLLWTRAGDRIALVTFTVALVLVIVVAAIIFGRDRAREVRVTV